MTVPSYITKASDFMNPAKMVKYGNSVADNITKATELPGDLMNLLKNKEQIKNNTSILADVLIGEQPPGNLQSLIPSTPDKAYQIAPTVDNLLATTFLPGPQKAMGTDEILNNVFTVSYQMLSDINQSAVFDPSGMLLGTVDTAVGQNPLNNNGNIQATVLPVSNLESCSTLSLNYYDQLVNQGIHDIASCQAVTVPTSSVSSNSVALSQVTTSPVSQSCSSSEDIDSGFIKDLISYVTNPIKATNDNSVLANIQNVVTNADIGCSV